MLRVAAVIACGVWLQVMSERQPRSAAPPAIEPVQADQAEQTPQDIGEVRAGAGLLPFQRLFAELDAHDQRMFRSLHEAMLEAERIRATEKRWPPVAELTGQGVPPFAADPTAAADGYRWTLHRQDTLTDYLGLPAAPGRPAFLLQFLEPDPLAPPHPPIPPDEEHALLADGTLIHVSLWSHPQGERMPDGLVAMPPATGWSQLLAGVRR